MCALEENVIVNLQEIFENFANKTVFQYHAFILQDKFVKCLQYIYNLKSHFPFLRTIVREMYKVKSIFNLLRDIDESLENTDVDKIIEYGEHDKSGNIVMENEPSFEILEDEIIDKHKTAFKSLKLKCLDTPKLECISCIKIY